MSQRFGSALAPSPPPRPAPPLPAAGGVCPARPFYDRAPMEVGVEQEFNGVSPQEAAALLAPMLGSVHVTQHTWMSWLGYHDVAQKGANLGRWRAAPDLSLSGAKSVELISLPLAYADTPSLGRATAQLVRHGASTDSMAALHIHVNRTSLPTEAVVQVLETMHVQQPMLFRLSRTSPRQAQYYARPLEPALLQSLRAAPPRSHAEICDAGWETARAAWPQFTQPADVMRFYCINLSYLGDGETLEFRQFDATTDPAQVQAFVDLTVALTTAARDGDLRWLADAPLDPDCPADVELFLDSLGVAGPRLDASRAALLRNARRPRPFEFAQGEPRDLGVDLALLAGGIGCLLWSGAPARLATLITPAACAAGARGVALLAESVGASTFELTHAVRQLTGGRFLLAHAALAAAGVGHALAGRARAGR